MLCVSAISNLTLDWVYGAFCRVGVFDILVVVILSHIAITILLSLVRVVGLVVVVAVLKHSSREPVRWRGELAAAELCHGGLAARTDDEDLILAPFSHAASHSGNRLASNETPRTVPNSPGISRV